MEKSASSLVFWFGFYQEFFAVLSVERGAGPGQGSSLSGREHVVEISDVGALYSLCHSQQTDLVLKW